MLLCKVVGNVISTWKQDQLEGQKLLVVQELHQTGTKKTLIAMDCVDAGVGDTVVVLHEGWSSRAAARCMDGAVDACIVGVVDRIDR